jgi:hypothetical protein
LEIVEGEGSIDDNNFKFDRHKDGSDDEEDSDYSDGIMTVVLLG